MLRPFSPSRTPIILGLVGFAAIYAIFGLTGCDAPHDEPRKVCLTWGQRYQTSRGLWVQDCAEYGLSCLKPLILDQRNGKLVCRLREPNEQG